MGGGNSKEEAQLDHGHLIAVFPCKYVGSVPVKAAVGNDVCQNAVQRILQLNNRERVIDFKVTSKGLYLIDASTKDIIKDVAISEVSFVGTSTEDTKVISFFENDKKARLITCHTFRVAKMAFKIPVAINEAFQMMKAGDSQPAQGAATDKKVRRSTSGNMSKKEALKASAAVHRPKVEKGNLLQTYNCTYLGTVNVSLPKGDEVVAEANGRILKGEPVSKCEFRVYDSVSEVINTADNDTLYTSMNRDISFAKTSDDKLTFSYIVHDRRLEKTQCTSFLLDAIDDEKPSVRRCLDMAMRALADKAKAEQEEQMRKEILDGGDLSKFNAASKADDQETGKIIGTFEASYLGSTPVKEAKGIEVVADASALVLKEKKSRVAVGVFLQIGTEGVKCIESLNHEILMGYVLKDISFTSVSGKSKELFAFIQKDENLGLINCHIFQCAGERAFDIATAFGEAFKAYSEEVKKTGGNPFAPIGERVPPPEELVSRQVHRVDLRPVKAIGAGQFGQVYLAEQAVAEGSGDNGGASCRRAVKMLRGGASESDRDDFLREAQVMFNLQDDHLVRIVGIVIQQKPWLMVLEYLRYGDLRNVLKAANSKNITLSYYEQLQYCLNVASGMSYIASQRMIHMDLACRNCLVGESNNVKIADFGITRPLPEGEDAWYSPTVLKLPVKWCSIEALDDRIFSEASDIWAFGVVMWEIVSYGRMPYDQLKTQEVQRKVREGLRLERPSNCPEELYELMHSCWKMERTERPNFHSLCSSLKASFMLEDPSDRDVAATVNAK